MTVAAVFLAGPALAAGGNVVAPTFGTGDSWVFDQTVEKGAAGFGETRLDMMVDRVGDDGTMVVGLKRDGAPTAYEDHQVGTDWSQRRVIDGEAQRTTRPFAFPMRVGKTWTVDFDDPARRGNQSALHVHRTYTVESWETVTVPAETFQALKVKATGIDHATIDVPNMAAGGVAANGEGAMTVSRAVRGGRRQLTVQSYGELYYVPQVKNFVKSVEEQYNTDGVRVVRNTKVLVSYRLSS